MATAAIGQKPPPIVTFRARKQMPRYNKPAEAGLCQCYCRNESGGFLLPALDKPKSRKAKSEKAQSGWFGNGGSSPSSRACT